MSHRSGTAHLVSGNGALAPRIGRVPAGYARLSGWPGSRSRLRRCPSRFRARIRKGQHFGRFAGSAPRGARFEELARAQFSDLTRPGVAFPPVPGPEPLQGGAPSGFPTDSTDDHGRRPDDRSPSRVSSESAGRLGHACGFRGCVAAGAAPWRRRWTRGSSVTVVQARHDRAGKAGWEAGPPAPPGQSAGFSIPRILPP
jgi:hypothetical protein